MERKQLTQEVKQEIVEQVEAHLQWEGMRKAWATNQEPIYTPTVQTTQEIYAQLAAHVIGLRRQGRKVHFTQGQKVEVQ